MTVVYAHARGAAWAADIAVAGGVAVAMTLTISVAQEVGATRSLDGLAYVLGLAIGLVLLARRRWPMQVFVVSVGLLLGYYLLDYPGFSAAVPLAVATYTVAAAGHTVAAAAVLLAFNAVGVAWQTIVEGIPLLTILGTYTLVNVALLAAVLLLGEAVRHRRAWAQEVRERLRQAEQHRAEEAARRLEDERFRIARELHDVLAHTIAAVSVQAGVAAEIIADSPDQARRSLQIIREQIREAIGELRAMVGLLRGSEPEVRHAPAPGLGELDTLVRFACRAGVDVECSVGGEVRPLPAAIELTAYRIVQESLTNVVGMHTPPVLGCWCISDLPRWFCESRTMVEAPTPCPLTTDMVSSACASVRQPSVAVSPRDRAPEGDTWCPPSCRLGRADGDPGPARR